jgi:hypothetical protein
LALSDLTLASCWAGFGPGGAIALAAIELAAFEVAADRLGVAPVPAFNQQHGAAILQAETAMAAQRTGATPVFTILLLIAERIGNRFGSGHGVIRFRRRRGLQPMRPAVNGHAWRGR